VRIINRENLDILRKVNTKRLYFGLTKSGQKSQLIRGKKI
jgi:hypothetical protein